jgi:hypothetical protein
MAKTGALLFADLEIALRVARFWEFKFFLLGGALERRTLVYYRNQGSPEFRPMSSVVQIVPSLPSLYDFFAPGGVLSRSSLPYEFRKGQLEMAQAVERALKEHKHLIV